MLSLTGLTLAFTAILIVVSYLYHESSFEDFHVNRTQIYRTSYETSQSDFNVHWARVPVDYINQLPAEIPGIEKLIRFQNQEQRYLRNGQDRYKAKHAYITDADVFEVFTYPLIAGDSSEALRQPNSIVLSKSVALQIFSQTDVIGQTLHISGDWTEVEKEYTITGIIDDVPKNTHLPTEILFSFANDQERSGWAYVYILLKENVDIDEIKLQLDTFIAKYNSDQNTEVKIHLQSLSSIHLHSDLAREITTNGNYQYLKIFFLVALFIWIIAIVNYSNLYFALALTRTKELGMRRILGADRNQLSFQLLLEVLFYCFIAILFSVGLTAFSLPYFHNLVGYFDLAPWHILFPLLLVVLILTTLMASLVPSLYIRSLSLIKSLKKSITFADNFTGRRLSTRKVLMLLQFTAAVILISATVGTLLQFRYLSSKHLGLNANQTLAIPNVPDAVVRDYPVFKKMISDLPGVEKVSACMQVPSSEIRDTGPVSIEGIDDPSSTQYMDIQVIDPEFPKMMQLKVLAGNLKEIDLPLNRVPEFNETLSPGDYLARKSRKYLINESGAKKLGWQDPEEAIGQRINFTIGPFTLDYGPVVAVVADYHQESLRNEVEPTLMVVEPLWLQTFLVKLSGNNLHNTIDQIEKTWNSQFPFAIEYHFLDDLFNQLYHRERIQVKLLSILSALAIFIAFLGLISLLAFTLKRRYKEMAIRRVVGANEFAIANLLGKEYLGILIVSTIAGVTLTHYWIKTWLDNFSYKASISPLLYLLPLIVVFLLAYIIIWIQTFFATRANPISALRDE